jgi:hypothetical protein
MPFEDDGRKDSKKLPRDSSKPALIGSYVVTGTDSTVIRWPVPTVLLVADNGDGRNLKHHAHRRQTVNRDRRARREVSVGEEFVSNWHEWLD